MSYAADPEFRRRAVRQAILHPRRFLAAALAEWPDEDLAAELRTGLLEVFRLRLARPPRPDHWHQVVQQLALAIDADLPALEALLQRVGVGR